MELQHQTQNWQQRKTVREKEATDYSKSEAELVEVADTVKRAISERR